MRMNPGKSNAMPGGPRGSPCPSDRSKLVLLVCITLACWLGSASCLGFGMSKHLRKNGVPGTAEILKMWDTGWTVNENPVIGMKVRVQSADRPEFEATIKKTPISRLATSQFQPGNVVPVRFDPRDLTQIAVDFAAPVQTESSSGNPYRDRFVRMLPRGFELLPPPAEPALFLGTADSGADAQALYENSYTLLGASSVKDGPDALQALEQGKAIGAAMVVVYGSFDPPPGHTLDVLPYRRRPEQPGLPAAHEIGAAWREGLFSTMGRDERFAAYWGKTPPSILGVFCQLFESREGTGMTSGVLVVAVADASPAECADILVGDVIVAVEGKPVADATALRVVLNSLAGKSVRIDLTRSGRPLSVTAQLNPSEVNSQQP
jgi:PDZ domain-containing protein